MIPDGERVVQPWIPLFDDEVELVEKLELGACLPLRTVPCYYGGRVPLEHHSGRELTVRIYRVRRDFVPYLGY